jgi:hypothetical protein
MTARLNGLFFCRCPVNVRRWQKNLTLIGVLDRRIRLPLSKLALSASLGGVFFLIWSLGCIAPS